MLTALTSGGKTLSDYTNLAEIGQGRFSVVFYAECKVRVEQQIGKYAL